MDITTDQIAQFVDTQKSKEKYSINNVSNEFAKLFDFMSKEKEIKYEEIDDAKNTKREVNAQRLNQL